VCDAYAEYRKLFDDSKVKHREIPVKVRKDCSAHYTARTDDIQGNSSCHNASYTRTRASSSCLLSLCTHLERIYTQPGRYGLCHSCCRNHIHLDLSHTRVRSSCKPTDCCNPVFENYGLFANEIHVRSGRHFIVQFRHSFPEQWRYQKYGRKYIYGKWTQQKYVCG